MSSKEQKTPEWASPEEIIMDQHEEVEAVEPNDSAEQVDPRDEKLRIWKFSLQKPRLANATPCCASKRKWKTCAVVLNRISKSA